MKQKTTTADTGAQCFLLGSDHLPCIGLAMENLLQSEINLSCANSTAAGNLGVLQKSEESITLQLSPWRQGPWSMLFSPGDAGLHSKTLPRVGEFLEPNDTAMTGKLFAINPYPTGWTSDLFYPELIPN